MKCFFISDIEKRIVGLFFGDLILIFFSFLFSVDKFSTEDHAFRFFEAKIIVYALCVIFYSYLIELYQTKRVFDRSLLLLRPFIAAFFSFISLSLIYRIETHIAVEISVLFYALIIFMLLQSLWHVTYYFLHILPFFKKGVLILGTGAKAQRIGTLLDQSAYNYAFKGYVGTRSDPVTVPKSQIVCDSDSLIEKVMEEKTDMIIIALTENRGAMVIDKLVRCKLMGVRVMDFAEFFEHLTAKLPVEDINPSWLVVNYGFGMTKISKFFKRVSDLLLAVFGLIVTLPLLPFVVLLIKLTSPGPVFYKQLRTGEMEKNFYIYKLRTMRTDAEAQTGAAWAKQDDPRITKAGSFLRKSRIDEIPQLFNILIGDMSFIGPRPERPEFVEQIKKLTPFYTERHFIKPGLTGWAQVKYRYGASFGDALEKLRYDLYYIKNRSFFLDVLIVFETIKVVLYVRGGR